MRSFAKTNIEIQTGNSRVYGLSLTENFPESLLRRSNFPSVKIFARVLGFARQETLTTPALGAFRAWFPLLCIPYKAAGSKRESAGGHSAAGADEPPVAESKSLAPPGRSVSRACFRILGNSSLFLIEKVGMVSETQKLFP